MSVAFWLSYVALWVLVLALLVAVVATYYTVGKQFMSTREGRAEQGEEVGAPMPTLAARNLGGTLANLPHSGRAAVFFFTATDCIPCERLRDVLALDGWGDGVDVAVVCAGSPGSVADWARPLDVTSAVIFPDPGQSLSARYRIGVTPYGMAVGQDGTVLAKGIMSDAPAIDWLLDHARRGVPADREVASSSQRA